MSFKTSHNPAAPGFGQTPDPFADLSRHDAIDEALDFDDTYDGLGDQLDETDDAFNDDTFGGDSGPSQQPVGKDFDFFGQTAKVSNAIEEEHQRFILHRPVTKPAPTPSAQSYEGGYYYQQAPKPARSGYEKYKDPEPASDLQIDASIWGTAPKKTSQPAAVPQTQQAPPTRKMMSLEEVEAAMLAQAQAKASAQQPQQVQPQPTVGVQESQGRAHATHYAQQEPLDFHQRQSDPRQVRESYVGDKHNPAQGGPHGHPVTILQRPTSQHAPPTGPAVPSPLSQQHQPPSVTPTQILQNPGRSGGEARTGVPTQPGHRSQNSFTRQHPVAPHASQFSHMSEAEKAAFLEAEARRAKRNYKIHLLSKDNGLMTPQDKSFITRIQLQQLVSATGDPGEHGTDAALAEDFYYQVLSSLRASHRPNPNQPLSNFAQTYLFQTGTRHGGMRRPGRGPENHMQRMEQQVQRAVEAAKNKPKNKQLVIEGSLGKISFSNAKTPKPLLNIKRTDSGTDTSRPGSGHRPQTGREPDKKETLRDIENVFATLLKLEDLTRHLGPPPQDGIPSQEFIDRQAEFQLLNEELWDKLKVHEPIGATAVHPFIAFISYAKGKRALQRVFRHLNHEQRKTILTMLVVHLDQLDVVRGCPVRTGEPVTVNAATRESIETFSQAIMPGLFMLFNELGLQIVTGVLDLILQSTNIDLVARTRIGISLLTMILSRAELIKQSGQANEKEWHQWVASFNQFFNALEPTLPHIFPGTVASGEDIYVWQFLAAIGIGASPDEQQRLVLAVKDRVMDTVGLSKTLPPDMAKERLDNVNLFMLSIGLDVELLK
ncbi:topoisomerase II-associated protein PAT1 [Xylariomycetidae sp. FL2044]|nr:topoisomerase II-associated protein PAT1 [Xylariomycetidae sp. FL2044]